MSKIYNINNHLMEYKNNFVNRIDPLNPLDLPPNTVRVRTSDGNAPHKESWTTYETATLVEGTSDVYDVYKNGTSFEYLLDASVNVIEVLGANTSNVTNMSDMFRKCSLLSVPLFDTSKVTDMGGMFGWCYSLTSVPLFNTSNVTDMSSMFQYCALQYIPLFDTSKVTTMHYMFYDCTNVQSGALALYQQISTRTKPLMNHQGTFRNCGSNTQTGAAELAQIPSDWK